MMIRGQGLMLTLFMLFFSTIVGAEGVNTQAQAISEAMQRAQSESPVGKQYALLDLDGGIGISMPRPPGLDGDGNVTVPVPKTDWGAPGESEIISIADSSGVVSDATRSTGLAPPASDLSVIFLGNLFGLVDGVLHGSGSQIMGVIFNVFNSAVLALGGIVMMYIIIVSTMNTAHEGQMLGQKWSSIWVPVRATMGLALLIPKSSGYCLMQIFVMWVVVQGVGIADKVWGTALDYLNRGGVIMQAQVDPTTARQAGVGVGGSNDNSVIDGASTILYGQVCMLALQTQLENQRKRDLDAKKEDTGPCAGQPSAVIQQYCDNSVPDFIGSVDPLAEYSKNSGETYSVQMPNLDSEPYSKLNGICGTLQWDSFDVSALTDSGAQNEEEEEEGLSEQAELIGRALQASEAQLDAAGPLQARATTPDSLVGNQYAVLGIPGTGGGGDGGGGLGGVIPGGGGGGGGLGGIIPGIGGGGGGGLGGIIPGIGGGLPGMPNMPDPGFGAGSGDAGSASLKGGKVDYEFSGGGVTWLNKTSDSGTNIMTLSQGDLDIIKKSRAAAIAQMYLTLASTARAIVSNDPQITPNSGNSGSYASPVADYQFGVPQTSLNGKCLTMSADCPYWGKVDGSSAPLLLDGTELQDAVTDYHSVMQPALKLLSDVQNQKNVAAGRDFIEEAKRSGWVLAGSYFFNLVTLNGSAIATSDNVDANSGLGKSTFNLDGLNATCSGNYAFLCDVFGTSEEKTKEIRALFTGEAGLSVPKADLSSSNLARIPNEDTIIQPEAASTVYGYANNAMLIDLPGQIGLTPKNLDIQLEPMNFKMNMDKVTLDNQLGCGAYIKLFGSKWCVERDLKKIGWDMLRDITNGLISFINVIAEEAVNKILILPLNHFMSIFKESMAVLTAPGTNPVLALAMMGVKYINMSMDTWISIVLVTLTVGLIPGIGAFIMLVMPLFMVWIGIMVGIGFITAYYIPFLPYMIFTFGALAWFIAVVEAMAAAPLVALGISHPEGHDAMGKSEQGLMILLNVFLRPAMMVIGFIAAIAMCYIGVWLLNSGFSTVLDFLDSSSLWHVTEGWSISSMAIPWASIFGFFFVVVIYTMIYLTLVEKSFSLIAVLPDKVLRWVGGQPESIGEQASQWTQDTKGKIDKAAGDVDRSMGAIQKGLAQEAMGGAKKVTDKVFGKSTGGGVSGGGS